MADQAAFSKKETILQAVKFGLVSASAGIIQALSFTLLKETGVFRDAEQPYGISYFIALTLSVLWNFTINRKFTFKSSSNVPIAMLKVLGFYIVFTPLSIWWGNALAARFPQDWAEYVILGGTMAVNLVTEFLYQRFFVFREPAVQEEPDDAL